MTHETDSLDQQVERLKKNSAYVATSYRLAPDEMTALKQALVMFAECNERLAKKLMALEAIRPRIVDVDGRKMRWDAPDSMVPLDVF